MRLKFGKTLNSFIFLFNDYKSINSGKIDRVKNQTCAVWCSNDILQFGAKCGGGSDILIDNNGKCSSYTNSYPYIKILRNFVADDIEVFQVIQLV